MLDSKSPHGTPIFLVRQIWKTSEAAEHHQGWRKFPGNGEVGGGGGRGAETGKKKGMARGALQWKCKLCFTTELF